jgi:hypothetical protein
MPRVAEVVPRSTSTDTTALSVATRIMGTSGIGVRHGNVHARETRDAQLASGDRDST